MLVAGGRSGVPVLGVPVSSECLCPRSACVLGVPVSSECLSSECLSSECLSFLAFSRTGPPVGGMLVAGGLCRHELVRNGASCGAGKVHRLLRVPPTGSSIPKDDPQGRSPRTIPKRRETGQEGCESLPACTGSAGTALELESSGIHQYLGSQGSMPRRMPVASKSSADGCDAPTSPPARPTTCTPSRPRAGCGIGANGRGG